MSYNNSRRWKNHPNGRKYKNPPSLELVNRVIKAHGISIAKFQLLYGIADTTIKKFKSGRRNLPVTVWHIFYNYEKKHFLPQKPRKPKSPQKPKQEKIISSRLADLMS